MRPLLLPLLLTLPSIPRTPELPRAEAAAFLEEAHALGYWNGAALVQLHGEDVFRGAAGPFDASADGAREVGVDDVFRIGSITKLFTQVALMRLVEAGEVDLEASLATYRPDLDAGLGGRVSLRQLLNFSSGFPSELEGAEEGSGVEYDAEGFAGPFLDRQRFELRFEPGARKGYSNLGYWYLGAVIEAVTGATYPEAVAALVLEPLGLEDTSFATTPGAGRACNGHENGEAGALVAVEAYDVRARYASGMMSSTLADLERLCRGVEDPDFLGDEGRLELYRAFQLDRKEVTKEGGPVLKASGYVPGWRSTLRFHPREGHLVILLNNRSVFPPPVAARLAIDCVNILRGEAPRPMPLNPATLRLEPAAAGLPDSALARAAREFVEAIGAASEPAFLDWHARFMPSLGREEVLAHAGDLFALPQGLDGWEVVGSRSLGERKLVLGVGREGAAPQLFVFTAESLEPLRIGDLAVPRRGR